MSDTSQGEGWWIASDGKWYPPESANRPPPPAPPASSQLTTEAPAVAPPKKSHTARTAILVTLGAIVVIIILAATLGGNKKPSATTATTLASAAAPTTPTTAAPATTTTLASPGLNQPALDGDFAFTVTSIQCGAAGANFVQGETIPAGSQECVAMMNVMNDKTTAQTFFSSNQYAYDASNHQYSSDLDGSIYLTNSGDFTQINPGVSITALVAFQIPASVTIDHLILHDSAFSGGVTVANR